MLLTDGCVKWNKANSRWYVQFNNVDESMHTLFRELGEKAFNEPLVTFMFYDKSCGVYISRYSRSESSPMICKLFSLTPTFNTKSTVRELPTLRFLHASNQRVKMLALRLAMSADGFVGISQSKGAPQPRIGLACANPKLVAEWSSLADDLGIHFNIDRDRRTWSGLHGLRTTSMKNIIRFKQIGGFYPIDVKVCRGYFKGKTKNSVLDSVTGVTPTP